MIQSLIYFGLAGLCEIAGGYLIWQWLRAGRSGWYALLGALLLIGYGIIPTLQPQSASFSRVYAAYGGVFIGLSLLWGWQVDGAIPDTADLAGAALALIGAAIMMYWPRG